MLLHIGENRFVPTKDVIAIVPTAHASAETERTVRDCVEAGHYYPSYGRPQAYVICSRDQTTYVYAAATAAEILRERSDAAKT